MKYLRVYHLVDPNLIIANQNLICGLCAKHSVSKRNTVCVVNPNRGHFIFKDLWLENFVQNKRNYEQMDKDRIQTIAQNFLTDADKRVRDSSIFKIKKNPSII